MAKYVKVKKEVTGTQNMDVANTVKQILTEIEETGEQAVRNYSVKFDKWNPDSFRVSEDEILKATKSLPETFIQDTLYCQEQVRTFAKAQLESLSEFEMEIQPGIKLGQKLIPISNVGTYVPGGRFPIIASAQMSVIPAKVAGVERVIVCTPSQNGQGIHPGVLFAIHAAGANEIYSIGGVQAIGAMAYGTENIEPVDFLVGPGNAFVAEAKRQVFGKVGIDQIAGPSEILVIADDTADPSIVAADLWGQSEHDPKAAAILIGNSEEFVKKVLVEMEKQLPLLETANVAKTAWENNGEIVIVKDKEEAVKVADQYAIEHLEVHAEDLEYYFKNLKNYGSLFLGEETTVAYGDKGIGTNHILPTEGAARYTGGLWVGKFIKTVTYQQCTKKASRSLAPVIARQCNYEGMVAHGVTADIRINKYCNL
ncbi:histidinol dehydrogenase [Anaerobacillus sp. MEB173]|uniref:histidinol dehydrogenase n=1 Tax=Anaerobacillus sp. MEB173 TaxID=3383345 RepID=UPI003F8F7F4E